MKDQDNAPWATLFSFPCWKIWIKRNQWLISSKDIKIDHFWHQSGFLVTKFACLGPSRTLIPKTNQLKLFKSPKIILSLSSCMLLSALLTFMQQWKWIAKRKSIDCLIPSNSLAVVGNIDENVKIRDKSTYITTICRELLQEGRVKQMQKVERAQTKETNTLARAMRQESMEIDVSSQFFKSPRTELNISLEETNFEHLCSCCNEGVILLALL